MLTKRDKMADKMTLYEMIIAEDNIIGAYHDLYKNYESKSQLRSYNALEGQTLFDTETSSYNLIRQIKEELVNLAPLSPVQYMQVPKKNGKLRDIYKLNVKERVKCQAVYRVLAPFFELKYSKYLYSYRSSHPCYYASRSLRRYYLRHFNDSIKSYLLKIDIKDYFDNINHEKLIMVLKKHGMDDNVTNLVRLFLEQPYLKAGELITPMKGVKGGLPLSSIFANIYLDHMDNEISSKVEFYRRVGDDIILVDKDLYKLRILKDRINAELKRAGLSMNKDKLTLDLINSEFTYLGLTYKDGKIRIPDTNYKRIVANWRKKLGYKEYVPIKHKVKKLNQILQITNGEKGQLFMSYTRAYNLVTDGEQINELSKRFMSLLTIFFTGGYSYKKIKQTKRILQNTRFPSLAQHFIKYTNHQLH